MPKLFFNRNNHGDLTIIVAKVVDDFSLGGNQSDINAFHKGILSRFNVGRYIANSDTIFNGMHISRKDGGSVHINMRN